MAALAAGATCDEAARAAGVSPSTVDRRLRDPEFRAEFRQLQREARQRTADALAFAATRAVARLVSVLDDPDAPTTVRVSAARVILDNAVRFQVSDAERQEIDPAALAAKIRAMRDGPEAKGPPAVA